MNKFSIENQYGEIFNFLNKVGDIWEFSGSEVGEGDNSISFVNFYCGNFIFNKEEIKKIMEYIPYNNLLYKEDYEVVFSKYSTSLHNTNLDYVCPICFTCGESNKFEYHHVLAASLGGSDNYRNILSVCKTCHSIMTMGDEELALIYHNTCLSHQMIYFPVSFFYYNNGINKRYGDRNSYLPKSHKKIRDSVIDALASNGNDSNLDYLNVIENEFNNSPDICSGGYFTITQRNKNQYRYWLEFSKHKKLPSEMYKA